MQQAGIPGSDSPLVATLRRKIRFPREDNHLLTRVARQHLLIPRDFIQSRDGNEAVGLLTKSDFAPESSEFVVQRLRIHER